MQMQSYDICEDHAIVFPRVVCPFPEGNRMWSFGHLVKKKSALLFRLTM